MQERIVAAVKHALAGLDYSRCLVFGSQARGDARPGSDVDLMIVFGDPLTRREKLHIEQVVQSRLADQLVPADILVKTEAEVEAYRGLPGSIVRNALAEGVPI